MSERHHGGDISDRPDTVAEPAAFYSHPWAWNEIGFGGPAYPRGYGNLGMDRRESWEVPDVSPQSAPVGDE